MKNLAGWLKHNPAAAAAAGLLFVTVFLYYVLLAEAPDDRLRVHYLAVGQGDAVLVEAPSGAQMLLDGGRGEGTLQALDEVMPFWDRSLDVVVATHPDQDHIGGLVEVLRRYRVDILLRSGAETDSGLDEALLKAAESEGLEVRELRAGDSLRLSPAVSFDVLFPPIDPAEMEPNEASIVGRLVYGDTAFLFTGDAPKTVERFLAGRYSENLESQVLKVGHHGSDTSSGLPLLGYSQAEFAVISAGLDNSYGHPHREVLERLELFGMEILETAEAGTVTFESDGREVRLLEKL